MKIVKEEHYVPEHRFTTTKYIAWDGKEFFTESDCLDHEEYLNVRNHPVFKNCILDAKTYYDDYNATLYYLSGEDDYNYLVEGLGLIGLYKKINTDFYQYGAGWYLYWGETGDCNDYYHIYNYSKYIKEIENDLKEYKKYIQDKINESTISRGE